MSRKTPKYSHEPKPVRQARYANDPSVRGTPLAWRFSHSDRNGPFAWTRVYASGDQNAVMERLSDFETVSETELREEGSHFVELSQLGREASERLFALRLDDLDCLFSLRISGPKRVWAVHQGGLMRVLWYDPEHQVCPSFKKHT